MKRLLPSLPALARLAALVILYCLDLLDLYGKVAWLGPSESFLFEVVQQRSFALEPLPRPAFLDGNVTVPETELGAELLRASGWTSFYDKCIDMYAAKDEERLDVVKAVDCDLGAPFAAERHVARELVLSASLRVDSVAWASCQLLFFQRRPPLCQENLVTVFSQRYRLPEDELHHDKMAPINSMAEAELLRMLNLLSRSHPLVDVVCAQGFESTAGPGHYSPTVFVCGSPNVFESAFIGTYATSFAEVHSTLEWLAVDKLNVMGFELLSRQNARSQFLLREQDGELVIVEESTANASTFGHIYAAVVLADVVLLVAHVRATIDTSRVFGWNRLLGFQAEEDDSFGKPSWILLYRSLHRSGAITAFSIFSAVCSWVVYSPYAPMWCHGTGGGMLAVLAAMRAWTIAVCLLNLLWGLFARLSEARAYRVVKRTYVTPLEALALSAFVVVLEANKLFSVSEARRQLDGQQSVDDSAFPEHLAIANACSEDLDGFATTPYHKLQVLFTPLAVVVVECLVLIAVLLIVKAAYLTKQIRLHDRDSASSTAVGHSDSTDEVFSVDPIADSHFTAAPLITRHRSKLYHRLPLEELLRTPARANSLVRTSFEIDEVEEDGLTYMLPHVYHEAGVVVTDAGLLRARRGFSNVLHRRLDVERFFAPTEDTASVLPSPAKRQRVDDSQAMGRAKFALNNMPSPADAVVTAQGSPSPPRVRSEMRMTPMSRSMRRRKSMENLLDNSSPTF
jgi:hypothetical protein